MDNSNRGRAAQAPGSHKLRRKSAIFVEKAANAKKTVPVGIKPTVLRYRGLELEALTSIQMRNIEMLRRMSTLLRVSVEMVAARQIEFSN